MICNLEEESPGDWGWKGNGVTWVVIWTTLPPLAESCQQLVTIANVKARNHLLDNQHKSTKTI
jgi:hypothetical protein